MDIQSGTIAALPVVLGVAKDPYFDVAYELSEVLETTLFTVDDSESITRGTAAYLVASPQLISQKLIRKLIRQGISVGVFTAETAVATRDICARITTVKELPTSSLWVAGNKQLFTGIRSKARYLDTSRVSGSQFLALTQKESELGLLVGHGREDVCYFENFAICGQSIENSSGPCNPTDCPILKPKIMADQISAQLVILFSCLAGRVGHGMFPNHCRVSQSMLKGKCRSIIAPAGLLTITPQLIDVALSCFRAGQNASEIARSCEEYQRTMIGETIELNVFGDPNFKKNSSKNTPTARPAALGPDLNPEMQAISRLVTGFRSIRSFGLLDLIDYESTGMFDNSIDKLGRICYQVRMGRLELDGASRILDAFFQLSEEITWDLIRQVSEMADRKYFWIAEYYDWFSRKETDAGNCDVCSQDTTRQMFVHPMDAVNRRVRTTCDRCGIIEDRDLQGGTIVVHGYTLNMGPNEYLNVDIEISLLSYGKVSVLMACINGSAELLVEAHITLSKDTKQALPYKLNGENQARVTLRLDRPKKGVYVAKLFLISDLHLTETSTPISFL